MSEFDRTKWNQRYREGACASRDYASELLASLDPNFLPALPRNPETAQPRALDLACGAGRNALYLADLGYQVDAVDIAEAGLQRGARQARDRGLAVNWIARDLDQGLPAELSGYALALVIRYLDLALVEDVATRLVPGGCLVCEVHLQTGRAVAGPAGDRFRAAPGALRQAASALHIQDYREGVTEDPDGREVALARLVAVKHQEPPAP